MHSTPRFDHNFLSLVGVRAGSQRILGEKGSWEAIAARLKQYSLLEICDIIGRLGSVLTNHESVDLETQATIAVALFGPTQGVALMRRLALMATRERLQPGELTANYTLFDQAALMVVLQIAVHVCQLEQPNQPRDYGSLGESVLLAADLIGGADSNPGDATFATKQGQEKWVYFFTVAALNRGRTPTAHLIARTSELFLAPDIVNSQHTDYVDLRAVFLEATGVALDAYALAQVYFLGTMYSLNRDNFTRQSAQFKVSVFTDPPLSLSAEEANRLFDLVGTDADQFRLRMCAAYPEGKVRPTYLLPIEESPIVRFGNAAVCVALPLLEQRLTSSIYHVLLNARRGPQNNAFRNRLLRYFGLRFEEYVMSAFSRIHSMEEHVHPKWHVALFSEKDLSAALNLDEDKRPPLCDGILLVGSAAFLFETKARMLSLDARSGTRPKEFFQKCDDIVISAARQLDSTANLLAAGAFRSLGLSRKTVNRIFPIAVSLQEFNMNPLLRGWINQRLEDNALLQKPTLHGIRLRELELMDVNDLEWCELSLQERKSGLARLLTRKAATEFGRGQSLANWGQVTRQEQLPALARLSHHGIVYRRVAEQAQAFFRSHAGNATDLN